MWSMTTEDAFGLMAQQAPKRNPSLQAPKTIPFRLKHSELNMQVPGSSLIRQGSWEMSNFRSWRPRPARSSTSAERDANYIFYNLYVAEMFNANFRKASVTQSHFNKPCNRDDQYQNLDSNTNTNSVGNDRKLQTFWQVKFLSLMNKKMLSVVTHFLGWNSVFGHNLLDFIWAQIGQEHEPLST